MIDSVWESRQAHWDRVYGTKALTKVSWYEPLPRQSLELIRASGISKTDPIIDVGGGASSLVDELLDSGYEDLTVLDVSYHVLQDLRRRLGTRATSVTLLQQDVTAFQPTRRYTLWHDRALFHFLVEPEDRKRYIRAVRDGLHSEGHLIIATFGPAGPQLCSGLPVVRYDATALAAELGAGFRLEDSLLTVHRTPSGSEQQFLYCRFRRHSE
jgi:hypothetical protein